MVSKAHPVDGDMTTLPPTTTKSTSSSINTTLIIILSVVGLFLFICVFYSLKNSCNNYYQQNVDTKIQQPYINLDKITVEESKSSNIKDIKDIKDLKALKIRHLSPSRSSSNKASTENRK
jgi:ABC-type protease/lipase transport system fused ATPase/permease subunit